MAGAFPGAPNNLDLHTTDGGTVYQYKADHDRWVIYKDSTAYVEKAGDTMTGDLTIQNTANDTTFIVKNANDDVFVTFDALDDVLFRLNENANNRVLIMYNAGSNYFMNKLYQAGDYWMWDHGGTEKMRIDENDMKCNVHMKTQDGHQLYAYSAGNDKTFRLFHDDTDAYLITSAGRIETRSTSLDVRNIADNDYVDVNANAFVESSDPLPDDPENWKELLPEFLKREVIKPIMEEKIDDEGNITYEKIGEEIKIGINTGMTARLALREVELLKKEIEELKKIVGSAK